MIELVFQKKGFSFSFSFFPHFINWFVYSNSNSSWLGTSYDWTSLRGFFFFFFYRNDRFFLKERSTWNLDLQYLRKLYPHFIFDFQYFKCKFDIECSLYFNIACPSLILILIQCLTLLFLKKKKKKFVWHFLNL